MSVARNTAYNFAGAVVPLIVVIVVTPVYVKTIGVERYGILALFWTILNSLGFLTLGMGPAVVQRLATMKETSDQERSQTVWTALILSLSAAALGVLAILLFGRIYFARLGIGGFQSEIREALPWLAAGLPLVLVSSVLLGALQGRQRFGVMNLVQITSSTLTSVVPLAVAYLAGVRLPWLTLGMIAVNATSMIVLLIVCGRAIPLRRPAVPSVPTIKQLANFGGWISLTSFLGPLLVYWDRFVIGATLGAAVVSAYVIPFNLVWQVIIVPGALASALLPQLAGAEIAESRRLCSLAIGILAFLMTPASLLMAFAAPPFLRLWLGQSFDPQSASVACILLFGIWINSFARIPYAHLQARGRPKVFAILLLIESLPYLGVVYLAVGSMGVAGVALVWSLRVVVDAVALFILDRTSLPSLRSLLGQGILLIIAIALSVLLPPFSVIRVLMTLAFGGLALAMVWPSRPPQVDQFLGRAAATMTNLASR